MLDPRRYQGVVTGALPYRLLFASISGAHLYGFPSPDSDVDVRGVCIPPARYLLGLSSFEQFEDRAGEVVIYGLAKFARLALANNPNMLDILWAEEEDVHGYDTKHAGHLLRLYTMGIEILREQVVRVRRPDAAWLRAVLGGRYTYDELMALVADLRSELAEAEAASALPAEPDVAAVEALVVDLQRRALGDARFNPHNSLGAARGLSFSRGEFSADLSLPEG